MAADPQRAATPPPTLTFPTDPSEFDSDDRISFSKLDNKFIAVHDDGTEFEYDKQLKRWIPVIDEELVRQQQSAYGGPLTAEDDDNNNDYENIQQYQRNKKRKKDDASEYPRPPRKQQRQNNNSTKNNTAVYVTGLPLDATADEVYEVFSRKCGVVAEEIDSGRPRIKMYADEEGNFKGDALVVFFKPQSVDMAIMLLDDTDFRYTTSGPTAPGRMRVQAADSSYKKTNYDNNKGAEAGGEVKTGGGGGGGGGGGTTGADRIEGGNNNNTSSNNGSEARPKDNRAREQDKQKIIKRTQKLDAKLADWDDDDPYAGGGPLPDQAGLRRDRLVVLRHMFTLRELDEDPAALLEIKEDVREECSKLGPVTNVVLYDLEPDGVVAVKFRHPDAADACVRLMDGRAFDGRIVRAAVVNDREQRRYRRSDKKQDDDAAGEDPGETGNDAAKNSSS